MATIAQKELKELLSYNPGTGIFVWKKRPLGLFKSLGAYKMWHARYRGAVAGHVKSHGYRIIKIYGEDHLAHRLAWLYVHGEYPLADTDHINHRRDDNRIANLRSVTHTDNLRNRTISKNNTSGYNGVGWRSSKSKWRANLTVGDKHIHLGYFTDLATAIWVREMAEIKYGFHENHGMRA